MKKRCSRCHARLDGNRKTCPYCGTMVRKRRGNVKVAASVGTSGVSGVLDRITLPALSGKHLLVIAAVIVAVIIAIAAVGCDSCAGCSSCGSACSACSFCGSCSSCSSCGACASCGAESGEKRLNGSNFNCEYYYDSTLYYVDGDRLMALEDGMNAGQPVLSGSGIKCVYVDEDNIYYIVSGRIFSSPVGLKAVSGSDLPTGTVLFEPVDLGMETINGFALSGDDEMCVWGQKADGEKIICVTDRSGPDKVRTVHTGKYSNVQCYGDSVYFASGEESTNGYIVRVDLSTGSRNTVFGQKANYFTLSGGKLLACVMESTEGGAQTATSTLVCVDMLTGNQLPGFFDFPRIRGIAANDQWIYYLVEDSDAGQTLVYRFNGDGSNHQLVFRKLGSYRLYGVAGDYFSLIGDDVYYICNYDQAPNSIVITEHSVLSR